MIPAYLQRAIQKAKSHSIILLGGDEEILRRRSLASLLKDLGFEEDDFDLESAVAGEKTISDWIAAVSTTPFLAEHRGLVVRMLLKLGDPKKLPEPDQNLLITVPPSGRLILVADEESTLDEDRQRRSVEVEAMWAKFIEKAGGAVISCKVDSKSLVQLVREEAKALGKNLSQQAAALLVEMTGDDYSGAIGELEKLVLYVGAEDDIREVHVRDCVTPTRDWNVFKLVDSILERKAAFALRQLRILLGSTNSPQTAGIRNILPNLSNQLRLLWQARSCLENRVGPNAAPEETRIQWPDKPNLGKEKDWKQNRVMEMARATNYESLRRCFEIVAEADGKLKGQLDAASGSETLELMLLQLIEALPTPARAR